MGSWFSQVPEADDVRKALLEACSRGDLRVARKYGRDYLSLPPCDYGEDEMIVMRACAVALGRQQIPLSDVFDHPPPYAQDYWNESQPEVVVQ